MHERKLSLNHLRPLCSTGCVQNPTHRHKKLGPRAIKCSYDILNILIRYLEHSKGCVKYGENPNSGTVKVDSRNVDFLEDKFLTISEIKKDLQLYQLQQDN